MAPDSRCRVYTSGARPAISNVNGAPVVAAWQRTRWFRALSSSACTMATSTGTSTVKALGAWGRAAPSRRPMRAVWTLRSRCQLADAVVTIVSDEEVAAAIDGYASRVLELGVGSRSSVAAKAPRRRPALLLCRLGLRGAG